MATSVAYLLLLCIAACIAPLSASSTHREEIPCSGRGKLEDQVERLVTVSAITTVVKEVCVCDEGFTGEQCEQVMSAEEAENMKRLLHSMHQKPCRLLSTDCENNGTFVPESCECQCVYPYTGPFCTDCSTTLQCENGGAFHAPSCSCLCPKNRKGLLCDKCQDDTGCTHGKWDNSTCTCSCEAGWSGTKCDVCEPLSCYYGGQFMNDTCSCQCSNHRTGNLCELCLAFDCGIRGKLNVATCICDCPGHWKGETCDICGLDHLLDCGDPVRGWLDKNECVCRCNPGFFGDKCDSTAAPPSADEKPADRQLSAPSAPAAVTKPATDGSDVGSFRHSQQERGRMDWDALRSYRPVQASNRHSNHHRRRVEYGPLRTAEDEYRGPVPEPEYDSRPIRVHRSHRLHRRGPPPPSNQNVAVAAHR
eukprot:GILK01001886.1.p1 GENE.GILK01001886.1~~GILK01001886.1.p1  ORF type:complete len:432 (+),score=54.18 GILK01001886.1:38-1297(+)